MASKRKPAQSRGNTAARKKNDPPEGKRFKKGQSGNPGGRPKVIAEFRAECQTHWREVLGTWLKIMRGKKIDPHAKNRAAELIANYAYGKPAQGVHFEDPDGAALTLVEIMRKAAEKPEEPKP